MVLSLLQDLAPYHREVNVNAEILAMYTDHLLLGITDPGNDNNYGSAAMFDVLCLQVLPLIKSHVHALHPSELQDDSRNKASRLSSALGTAFEALYDQGLRHASTYRLHMHCTVNRYLQPHTGAQSSMLTARCSLLPCMWVQALSKRIHCGKFVAEAKFRSEREVYSRLIAAQDAQGILDSLTNRDVELQVLPDSVKAT